MFEPEVSGAIQEELDSGDTFYDVGANVGYHTLLGSKRCGSTGTVVAFEPLPRNVEFIKCHLRENGVGNTKVRPIAITGEKSSHRTFLKDSPQTGKLDSEGELQVVTNTIDSEREKLPPPDLMKVDVEGEELAVLCGAEECLKRDQPALVVETHGKERRKAVEAFLESVDYSSQVLRKGPETVTLLANAPVEGNRPAGRGRVLDV